MKLTDRFYEFEERYKEGKLASPHTEAWNDLTTSEQVDILAFLHVKDMADRGELPRP